MGVSGSWDPETVAYVPIEQVRLVDGSHHYVVEATITEGLFLCLFVLILMFIVVGTCYGQFVTQPTNCLASCVAGEGYVEHLSE